MGDSAELVSIESSREMLAARRLRAFELVLVVGTAFLVSAVYSLYAWWNGDAVLPDTAFSSLQLILNSILSISLLVYVLHRQGRSLRMIGLTARVSDIPLALLVTFFFWLIESAIYATIANDPISEPTTYAMELGFLAWLAVVPSAATEELIVRAFLMTEVAALTGSMGVAVFASVGFQTLYHLYQGTPAALMNAGAFFVSSVFYASTRRITPVILAHSLYNFWALAAQPQ